jgi:predicted Zn-dependent protease
MEEKLKNSPPGSKKMIQMIYGMGSRVGFNLPYSRVMEYEADRLSVIFLHKAGLDPNAAVKLMELFAADSNKLEDWTEFLSTHPVSAKRLARLKEEVELLKKQQ